MRITVNPLNSVAAPGIAIEIGPPARGGGDSIDSPHYQQALSAAIAGAVAANRARLPHGEAAR
jgi:hypothetical protein